MKEEKNTSVQQASEGNSSSYKSENQGKKVIEALPTIEGSGSMAYESTSFNKVHKVPYEVYKTVSRGLYCDYMDAARETKKVQDMAGFDECYTDFVDYINRCTHRIWDENNVGLLYTHCANNTLINSKTVRNTHGIEDTISGTLEFLHGFPDRKGVSQNVIWSGNDKEGYFSSHRGLSHMTNTGDSSYGPATGKRIKLASAADCEVYRNRITREWLIRDGLYFVHQLGLDPIEFAKKQALERKSKMSPMQNTFGIAQAMEGQYAPPVYQPSNPGKFEIGDFILGMFNKIHEWKLLACVKDYYADNANLHFICDKDLIGFNQIKGLFVSFYASFAKAQIIIDRVTCDQVSEGDDWDVAVRWRVIGINNGYGYFGKPTGKQIELLTISQFKIRSRKIIEEWMLFDGMDVLRQMYTEWE